MLSIPPRASHDDFTFSSSVNVRISNAVEATQKIELIAAGRRNIEKLAEKRTHFGTYCSDWK